MQGTAILFTEATPPPDRATAFEAWYDTEQIPRRVAVPGVLSAQRYRHTGESATGFLAVQPGGPGAEATAPRSLLAVYELTDLAVLRSTAWSDCEATPSAAARDWLSQVSGITRTLGMEIAARRQTTIGGAALDAALLYAVWFNVPPERTGDVDAWYEQEHVPLLMECPGWLMARRFAVNGADPGPFNRFALHYLADRSALESAARFKARGTPWRARLAAEPWFRGTYKVFERDTPRQAGRIA
jgi:hypothetical protein